LDPLGAKGGEGAPRFDWPSEGGDQAAETADRAEQKL